MGASSATMSRALSSVVLGAAVSRTRIPGFEKATLTPRAKFFPLILSVTWLPGATRGGSTEDTSGVPVLEVWVSAGGGAGAEVGVVFARIVNGTSATVLAGLLMNRLTAPAFALGLTASCASSRVALTRRVERTRTHGLENETYAPAEKFRPSIPTVSSSPGPAWSGCTCRISGVSSGETSTWLRKAAAGRSSYHAEEARPEGQTRIKTAGTTARGMTTFFASACRGRQSSK